MEADMAAFTGRTRAEEAQVPLWLSVEGPDFHWPGARTSVVTTLLDTLRKGIQAGAEWIATGTLSARPTHALQAACDLEAVVFAPGSIRVGLRLPLPAAPEPNDVEQAAQQSLEKYLAVAAWAGSEANAADLAITIPDDGLRRVLLAEVKRLVPRQRGGATTVRLSGRAHPGPAVVLSRDAHTRIDVAIDAAAAATAVTCSGDLREIDLDRRTFILRNVAEDAKDIQCAFEAELFGTVVQALTRRVEVHGERTPGSARGKPKRLRITRLVILDDEPDAPAS